MIQATNVHYLTLGTTNEKTEGLAEMIHNMGEWLHQGLIKKDTYVNIHDILRHNIGTENFISVVGYLDEREEKNEYSIKVIEFPEKSDGTIRSMKLVDDTFYLLTKDEENDEKIKNVADAVFGAIGYTNTEEKGEK